MQYGPTRFCPFSSFNSPYHYVVLRPILHRHPAVYTTAIFFGVTITLISVFSIFFFTSSQPIISELTVCQKALLESNFTSPIQQVDTSWLPPGCSLKFYNRENVEKCLSRLRKNTRNSPPPVIVFMGDSRIRQLRDQLYAVLTGIYLDWLSNSSVKYEPNIYEKHQDQVMTLSSVVLKFYWGSNLTEVAQKLTVLSRSEEYPQLLVIGRGLWTNTECRDKRQRKPSRTQCLADYSRVLMGMMPLMVKLAEKTPVIWVPQTAVTRLLLSKASDPGRKIDPVHVNSAVRSTMSAFVGQRITFWNSFESTFSFDDSLDGIHLGPKATHIDGQILLNFLCDF